MRVAIGKTNLPSDDVDRMSALLRHEPGRLDAQVLDPLGRRLPGLGAESATELALTQVRRLSELSNRQRLIEIALRVGQRALDTVGFGLQPSSAENCDCPPARR
jgi:hypothetical protein